VLEEKRVEQERFKAELAIYYRPIIYGNLRRRIPERMVDDVVQESLIKVLEVSESYSDDRSLTAWVLMVSKNVCGNVLAKQGRRNKQETLWVSEPFTFPSDHFSDLSLDLSMCIETLSLKPQEIIILNSFETGESGDELAKLLDEKPGTIRQQKRRLLKKLKDCITRRQEARVKK